MVMNSASEARGDSRRAPVRTPLLALSILTGCMLGACAGKIDDGATPSYGAPGSPNGSGPNGSGPNGSGGTNGGLSGNGSRAGSGAGPVGSNPGDPRIAQ